MHEFQNKHVLLIDDNENDNFFHERAILKSGIQCKIDICSNGEDALDYLLQRGNYAEAVLPFVAPNLIFLDINMPLMNGWQFLEEYTILAENKNLHPSPIIVMLSDLPNSADRQKADSHPWLRDFIRKPVTPESFEKCAKPFLPEGPKD